MPAGWWRRSQSVFFFSLIFSQPFKGIQSERPATSGRAGLTFGSLTGVIVPHGGAGAVDWVVQGHDIS